MDSNESFFLSKRSGWLFLGIVSVCYEFTRWGRRVCIIKEYSRNSFMTRKIERQMQAAIATRTDWRKSNTSVSVDSEGFTSVRLHGNRIAEIDPNGDIILSSCGWDTPTTKSRLNAILDVFISGCHIFQKDFTWYVGDLNTPFFDGFRIARWRQPQHLAITPSYLGRFLL